MTNVSNDDKPDYIVVGAGAAGSALAADFSASGAPTGLRERHADLIRQ